MEKTWEKSGYKGQRTKKDLFKESEFGYRLIIFDLSCQINLNSFTFFR